MLIFELADRTRVAIRGSGTEPKIKYYLFAQQQPKKGKFATGQLALVKESVNAQLDLLWQWMQEDARHRLAS